MFSFSISNLWMHPFWLIFDSNFVEYFKLIMEINSTYISIFCECMMTCKSTECYQWWLYSKFIDLVSQCFQYFLSTIFNAEVWVFYVRTPAWMLLTVQLTYHAFLVSSQAFNQICIAWYGAVWCHSDVMAASNTRYLIPSW